MTAQAYIMYNREKTPVIVESYFVNGDGRMMCNVTAVNGYPFNGHDVEAQGDYFRNTMQCNGLRVRADFVKIEISPDMHAVDFASELEADYQPTEEEMFLNEWAGDWENTNADTLAGTRF